eukprot:m.243314 g.243314  ORF g.243314 m.243314 type:complete len:299 (+) comp19446_c0_seq2:318-1214(+)
MDPVAELFAAIDINNHGKVDRFEFLEFMRVNKPQEGDYTTTSSLNRAFGLNTAHSIDLKKFREAFENAGPGLTPDMFRITFKPVRPTPERFFEAVAIGAVPIVEEMLRENADPDHVRESDGATALYVASTEGHVDVVRLLLAASTKTINHQTNVNGKGALLKASVRGHKEIVRMLLAAGADVNQKKGWDEATALFAAAYAGHTEVMTMLLDAGADTEIPLVESSLITHFRDAKYYGSTALIVASFFDHPAAVRVLLDRGANPDAKTLRHQTALDVATSHECRQLLKPVTGQKSGVYTK